MACRQPKLPRPQSELPATLIFSRITILFAKNFKGGLDLTGHEKTPKEIVAELDKYVVGQAKAKKAVAIALRNRYRRMQLSEDMQEEITPKNMLMIGPTGVGKTEIARRLAKIVDAPFIKVEATKFTEVGYVGRDVESMVRDLVEVSYKMEEDEMFKNVRAEAVAKADKRLVKLLVPAQKKQEKMSQQQAFSKMMSDLQSGNYANLFNQQEEPEDVTDEIADKRMSVAEKLRQGYLENEEITLQMDEPSSPSGAADGMLGQMGVDLSDALAQITPKKKITRTVTVKEAREILVREESAKLVNSWDIADAAIKRAENTGILFVSGRIGADFTELQVIARVGGLMQHDAVFGIEPTLHALKRARCMACASIRSASLPLFSL